MNLTIITNGQERELVCLDDLPAKAQKDFDYITDDERFSNRFIKYKRSWYDTGDVQEITTRNDRPIGWAMVVEKDSPLAQWNAIVSETFFSGILFRYVGCDSVIIGRYYS